MPKKADWFAWLPWPQVALGLALLALFAVLLRFSGGEVRVAPVAYLQLMTTRGDLPSAVPAQELDFTLLDAPAKGPALRASIINAAGQSVWSGQSSTGATSNQVKAQRRLEPGDYLLRLSTPSGEVVREYGFRIRQ